MGTLALAAKITHVPSMYLSEFPGPNFGCRDAAINGHKEIDRRCRALGVDTIVVFDVHWQVNSEYHINCGPKFGGTYTSNELPHFIKNMPYAYPGNPALGHLIADVANEMGVKSRAHSDTTLELEYGTLVPMRYMNADQHYKVISISGWCDWHDLTESGRFGLAVRRAIEERYEGTVAVFASGSLSHHFADNGRAPNSCTRSTIPSSSRWTAAWSSSGRPATGRPSSACCRCTPTSAGAKATCTTPQCCWASWAGTATPRRWKWSRPISGARARDRSMPSSP